jgi:hypothetical protein
MSLDTLFKIGVIVIPFYELIFRCFPFIESSAQNTR